MSSTPTTSTGEAAIIDNLRGTRDSLTITRVFGDPYTVDGVTIVPVARLSGGGGGGGGEGSGPNEDGGTATGNGFGTGFGVSVRAIGVYEVRGDRLTWKPAIDVERLARNGQILAGVITLCATLLLLRRTRTT